MVNHEKKQIFPCGIQGSREFLNNFTKIHFPAKWFNPWNRGPGGSVWWEKRRPKISWYYPFKKAPINDILSHMCCVTYRQVAVPIFLAHWNTSLSHAGACADTNTPHPCSLGYSSLLCQVRVSGRFQYIPPGFALTPVASSSTNLNYIRL